MRTLARDVFAAAWVRFVVGWRVWLTAAVLAAQPAFAGDDRPVLVASAPSALDLYLRDIEAQPVVSGGAGLNPNKSARALSFISTGTFSGGAGATPKTGNFSCPNNPANSSPCLMNPNSALEIAGNCYQGNCASGSASVYISNFGLKTAGPIVQVLNNYGVVDSAKWEVDWNGDTKQSGDIYTTSTTPHVFCNGGVCILRGGTGGAAQSFLFTADVSQTSGTLANFYSNPAGSPVFSIDAVTGAAQMAGVATVSLPTCNAGNAGKTEYDTTVSKFANCNGSAWVYPVTSSVATPRFPVHFGTFRTNGIVTTAADFEGYWNFAHDFVASGTTVGQTLAITCDADTTGAGGTTGVVMKLGTGAGSCTCNLGACNSINTTSHSTCHCTTTGVVTDMFVEYNPTTDCTTRPSNMFCTVQGSATIP